MLDRHQRRIAPSSSCDSTPTPPTSPTSRLSNVPSRAHRLTRHPREHSDTRVLCICNHAGQPGPSAPPFDANVTLQFKLLFHHAADRTAHGARAQWATGSARLHSHRGACALCVAVPFDVRSRSVGRNELAHRPGHTRGSFAFGRVRSTAACRAFCRADPHGVARVLRICASMGWRLVLPSAGEGELPANAACLCVG